MSIQLGLDLQNLDPLSPRYLVVHSGIVKAVEAIRISINQLASNSEAFFSFSIFGEKGSGKTHILKALKAEAEKLGVSSFEEFEFGVEDENLISQYVAAYERTKANGGIIVAALIGSAEDIVNPHLRSRVLAGQVLFLEKPQESELREILNSLLANIISGLSFL